jgi:hypothetical protein
VQAIQIPTLSPLIGRPVKNGTRDLVICRGSRGYTALCCFVTRIDTVSVLATRSQRGPWPIGWANTTAVAQMAATHHAATNSIANGG